MTKIWQDDGADKMFTKKRKPLYKIGQKVRIAPLEKIENTLDERMTLNGVFFMDQMRQYCGTEVTIKKIVRKFEGFKNLFSVKEPIYLFNQVICDGNSELLEKKCDFHCHLMWHEDWLE
jgi:hypothetical protein